MLLVTCDHGVRSLPPGPHRVSVDYYSCFCHMFLCTCIYPCKSAASQQITSFQSLSSLPNVVPLMSLAIRNLDRIFVVLPSRQRHPLDDTSRPFDSPRNW